jgi:hypothetical protein
MTLQNNLTERVGGWTQTTEVERGVAHSGRERMPSHPTGPRTNGEIIIIPWVCACVRERSRVAILRLRTDLRRHDTQPPNPDRGWGRSLSLIGIIVLVFLRPVQGLPRVHVVVASTIPGIIVPCTRLSSMRLVPSGEKSVNKRHPNYWVQ